MVGLDINLRNSLSYFGMVLCGDGSGSFARQLFARQSFARQTFARQLFARQSFARQTFARQLFTRQSFARQLFARQLFARQIMYHKYRNQLMSICICCILSITYLR